MNRVIITLTLKIAITLGIIYYIVFHFTPLQSIFIIVTCEIVWWTTKSIVKKTDRYKHYKNWQFTPKTVRCSFWDMLFRGKI